MLTPKRVDLGRPTKEDVLADGQLGNKRQLLVHGDDACAERVVRRVKVCVFAVDAHRAGCRQGRAGQYP